MKYKALIDKPGMYEIRQHDETIFGGIYINGKNKGVGFVGKAEENQYIFEFEDGMFSKSVKIFYQTKDNQIGAVELGFTDSGTLRFGSKTYEWQVIGASKIWLDSDKDAVMFFDLENNSASAPNVLISSKLDAKTNELLALCGWYLLVIEWRAGFSNSILAGMPVKTPDSLAESKPNDYGKDWIDVIFDAATKL